MPTIRGRWNGNSRSTIRSARESDEATGDRQAPSVAGPGPPSPDGSDHDHRRLHLTDQDVPPVVFINGALAFPGMQVGTRPSSRGRRFPEDDSFPRTTVVRWIGSGGGDREGSVPPPQEKLTGSELHHAEAQGE